MCACVMECVCVGTRVCMNRGHTCFLFDNRQFIIYNACHYITMHTQGTACIKAEDGEETQAVRGGDREHRNVT